jgi:hypothetical protein
MGQAVRDHHSFRLFCLAFLFSHTPVFFLSSQRYQFRLKHMGKHSTLSDDREDLLNTIGFVWDSHQTTWNENFRALEAYTLENGHCYISPQLSSTKASLISWCKHQRRQYKLYQAGLDSTMTTERIRYLESIGFDWDPRNLFMKQGLIPSGQSLDGGEGRGCPFQTNDEGEGHE